MQILSLGAIAPALLMSVSATDAQPARLAIPVTVEPNPWVFVQWVTVKSDSGRTIVSGYVRNKKWFANWKGDLHVAFLKGSSQAACRETKWKREHRLHSHGRMRFSAVADIPASEIDSVRISHVIHSSAAEASPSPAVSCPNSDQSTGFRTGSAGLPGT